jgi:hypothetical protein
MERKITKLKLKTRTKLKQQEVVMPTNAIILGVNFVDEGFCESSIELTILGSDETMKGTFIVAQDIDTIEGEVRFIGSTGSPARYGRTGYERAYYVFEVLK